jgi:hypothetical protein
LGGPGPSPPSQDYIVRCGVPAFLHSASYSHMVVLIQTPTARSS